VLDLLQVAYELYSPYSARSLSIPCLENCDVKAMTHAMRNSREAGCLNSNFRATELRVGGRRGWGEETIKQPLNDGIYGKGRAEKQVTEAEQTFQLFDAHC